MTIGPVMSEEELDLRQMLWELYTPQRNRAAFFKRDIVCTPFKGKGKKLASAGWVICVAGNPPKGTITVLDNGGRFYIFKQRGKVLTKRKRDPVDAFHARHLKGRNKAIIFSV